MCAAPARLGLVSSLDIGAGALEPLSELIGPPACVYTPSNAQRACTPAWLRLYVKLTSGERALHDAERAAFHAVHDAFCARGSGRWRDFVRGAAHTPTGSRALAGYHAARRVVTTAAEKLALVPQLLQRHRGERCLVVAPDAAAAHDLGRRLGVPPVGDDSALVERASVLRAFQEGALRVLVATGLEQVRIRCDSATVGVLLGQRSGDEGTQLARLLAPRSGSGAAPVVYEVISRETYEDTPLTQLFGHASPADRDYQMRHSAGAGAGLAWSARRYSRWPASPASP
jgi:superfamily II DNA or RNA helicase